LKALTASLPSAGTIERIACGATMRSITTSGVIPGGWLGLTGDDLVSIDADDIAANDLAMKGASFSASGKPAASTAVSFMPIMGMPWPPAFI
jgi:hypothetical protein